MSAARLSRSGSSPVGMIRSMSAALRFRPLFSAMRRGTPFISEDVESEVGLADARALSTQIPTPESNELGEPHKIITQLDVGLVNLGVKAKDYEATNWRYCWILSPLAAAISLAAIYQNLRVRQQEIKMKKLTGLAKKVTTARAAGGSNKVTVSTLMFFKDPDVGIAFIDENVMSAMMKVLKDPAALSEYESDPQIANILANIVKKYHVGTELE